MTDENMDIDVAEDIGEDIAQYLRELPFEQIPAFLDTLNDELEREFLLVVSADHPPGTCTIVEVTEENTVDDGRVSVPTSGFGKTERTDD